MRNAVITRTLAGHDVAMDRAQLGLPDEVDACLFDMDGVLTRTATLHAQAWKQMFDEFLRERGKGDQPFALPGDYEEYVDGKPRYDGVRDFLASRHIDADDALVHKLGDRKNELVQELIRTQGVETFPGSIRYVRAARDAGLKTAVVSSSKNTREVLDVTGIADLFDDVVDGHAVEERGLKGKPAPDTFVAAAHELGTTPEHAAVYEDATAGVAAGRAGHFARVIGVDRGEEAEALKAHGADIVVKDLEELLR
jgi:beta-phosphoglucomutase family hydrolase